jgi:hypothetical protein
MNPTPTHVMQLAVAVAVAVLAFAACSNDDEIDTSPGPTSATGTSPTSGPAASALPTASTPPVDVVAVLPFVDEFDTDTNGWAGPFQRFENGAYVWDLPSGQSDVRAADALIDVEDQIDDAVITTTFTAVGVEAVGIQCAYEALDGSSRWYDLELTTGGAIIRKRPTGTDPIEQLAANDTIALTDQPIELVAECRRDTDVYHLRLLVDGTPAAEASDPEPFGRAGAPNLSVRALPTTGDVPQHVVRFDRFEVSNHSGS